MASETRPGGVTFEELRGAGIVVEMADQGHGAIHYRMYGQGISERVDIFPARYGGRAELLAMLLEPIGCVVGADGRIHHLTEG